jgi:hypothetical protein
LGFLLFIFNLHESTRSELFIAPSKMDEYDQYDSDSPYYAYYGRTPMTDEQIEEKTRIFFEANAAIYREEAPELSKHVQQVNKAPRTIENDIRSVGRVLADKDVSRILPVLRGAGTDINSPAYQNLGQSLLADGVEERPTVALQPAGCHSRHRGVQRREP